MALIWTLISPKGGAGKTTMGIVLAGEFANKGKKVTIIDTDPRARMVRWKEKNALPENITVIQDTDHDGKTLPDNIDRAVSESDIVIIDTEGTNNVRSKDSIQFSDLVIIPIASSIPDLEDGLVGVELVNRVSKMARRDIPYCIVRTRINPAILTRDEKHVRAVLDRVGEPVCDAALLERPAFVSMQTHGGTVYTLNDKQASGLEKARLNSAALFDSILRFYKRTITASQDLKAVG